MLTPWELDHIQGLRVLGESIPYSVGTNRENGMLGFNGSHSGSLHQVTKGT